MGTDSYLSVEWRSERGLFWWLYFSANGRQCMIDIPCEYDDGIAWPSYVDFLFAFCFVLVLSLGYMAFMAVHGVEGQDFQREAVSGRLALENLGITASIDWDRRTIEIPLSRFISFERGCPSKT
jgi:hypothetical protein